jgi:hypothetical protein
MSLLLINDGQDMKDMGFEKILEQLYGEQSIEPLLCAAIMQAGKKNGIWNCRLSRL